MPPTSSLPPGVQRYPLKSLAVLPGPLVKHPLDPSYLAHSPANGKLAVPLDPTKPFVVYHDSFLELLGDSPALELVASGEAKEGGDSYPLMHEAGIWLEETKEVIFTSNCNPTFDNVISRITLPIDSSASLSSTFSPLAVSPATSHSRSVIATNGGTLYRPAGKDLLLLCCQGTTDIPSSLSIVDPTTGESTCLLNNYHGRPFNAINDVVVLPPLAREGEEETHTGRTDLHGEEGTTIWFTDPSYASAQGYKGEPQMPMQVYCFTPATGDVRVVADGFFMPNGLCFSPSGDRLYVTDTGLISGDGNLHLQRPGTIYVYDVVRPRPGSIDPRTGKEVDLTAVQPTLSDRRVFAYCDAGVPDGIKTDKLGNVYSGTGEGISIWNPTGTLLGKITLFPSSLPSHLSPANRDPSTRSEELKARYCANFNFCPDGRLFILAEDRAYVATIRRGVEGALLP